MARYKKALAAGWEFSHNENGSIIVCRKWRTMEAEGILEEAEITKHGELRTLPKDSA